MTRKRNNKRARTDDNSQPTVDDRDRKSSAPIIRQCESFERFYQQQSMVPAGEWADFMACLQTDLPSSFRIIGTRSSANKLRDGVAKVFTDQHLLAAATAMASDQLQSEPSADREGEDTSTYTADYGNSSTTVPLEPPCPIAFYPDRLAWQYSIPRRLLRRSKELESLQRFLINETEVGNISRQEAVSMIPPLLLDVQSDHLVLDMCAAPGSKTSQIVEMVDGEACTATDLYNLGLMETLDADGKNTGGNPLGTNSTTSHLQLPRGLVIANDTDSKRCYTLIHRMKSLQSPSVLVTNHDASQFPTLYINEQESGVKQPLRFDRILCDVPCSGDGTLRKNPLIWRTWNPNNAMGLHPYVFFCIGN